MQILVLGMHRSGTSLITGIINKMGAYAGPGRLMLPPTAENPRGFWERQDTLEINRAVLRLHGCDWANTANWPLPFRPVEVPPGLQQRMQALIGELDAHRPWVMKDPRLCLTLSYWKKLLKDPVCVIVYRDPMEIAESLYKRNQMEVERGLALWESYAAGMLSNAAGLSCVYAAHEEFLRDPVSATERLYKALEVAELHLPEAHEITAFVDPKLYRSRVAQAYTLNDYQQSLIGMLQGKSPPQLGLKVSDAAQKLLRQPLATPYA